MNLDLEPQRIESVALDGVEHADGRLSTEQAFVGHENDVDGLVMLDERFSCTFGQFLEVDGEQLIVLEGGHHSRVPVEARAGGSAHGDIEL